MVKALLLAVATACGGSLSAQSPAPGTPAEACVKELRTPVRHVCGDILTREGERDGVKKQVRNAVLTLMRDGKLIAREETNDKATFDFTEKLTDGLYDLMVEAANHTPTRFRIIVHKQTQKCSKGTLELTLPLGAECGDIHYWPRRYVDFDGPDWTRERAVQIASAITLIIPQKGEGKAQASEIACFQQLSLSIRDRRAGEASSLFPF